MSVQLGRTGPSPEAVVADYLADHKSPGDTGVVAYGQPQILEQAGLASPYPQLWSLPVRVLDSHLRALKRVLSGADRPTWVVTHHGSLGSWGLHSTWAQRTLDRGYHPVAQQEDYTILHRNFTTQRPEQLRSGPG